MGTDLLANAVCQRCTCLVPPPRRHPVLGIQYLLWQEGALGPSELQGSQGSQLGAGVTLTGVSVLHWESLPSLQGHAGPQVPGHHLA